MKAHKVQGCRLVRPQNRAQLISGSSEDSWNKSVSPNLIYTLLYNVFVAPSAPSFSVNVIVLDFCPPATRLRPVSLHLPSLAVASSSVTNVAVGAPQKSKIKRAAEEAWWCHQLLSVVGGLHVTEAICKEKGIIYKISRPSMRFFAGILCVTIWQLTFHKLNSWFLFTYPVKINHQKIKNKRVWTTLWFFFFFKQLAQLSWILFSQYI